MTDLTKLHAKFWDFRRMMEPYWPTPDIADAARFAKTEATEALKENGLWEAFVAFAATRQAQIVAGDALDAVLRKNISYSRNTVRDMDERNELADLAMMLLTTMGEESITSEERPDLPYTAEVSLDKIVDSTNDVYRTAVFGGYIQLVRRYALITLKMIDRYPGMNLPMMLQARMNRIYRKHHPGLPPWGSEGDDSLVYPAQTEGLQLAEFDGYHPE